MHVYTLLTTTSSRACFHRLHGSIFSVWIYSALFRPKTVFFLLLFFSWHICNLTPLIQWIRDMQLLCTELCLLCLQPLFFFFVFKKREKTESYPITTNQFLFLIYLYACLQIQFVIIIILFFVTVNSDFSVGGKKNHSYRRKASIRPSKTITYLSSNMYIM